MILWLTNTVLATEIWELSLTKPSAQDITTQISVGKSPFDTLFYMRPGVDVTASGGFPPIASAKKGWRIGPLTGNMIEWWWTGTVKVMNNEPKGIWTADVEVRLSKSPNADGSNATQINTDTAFLPAVIPPTVTRSWYSNKIDVVPAQAFSNEYLFLEFEIRVANPASDADADLKFYVNDGIAVLRTPPYEDSTMETSYNSPTAFSGKYTNPSNAFVSDGTYATCTVVGFSETYKNYNYSLGTLGINEVWIECKHYEAGGNVQPFRISWDGGTNWSSWYEFVNPGPPGNLDRVEVTDIISWDSTKLNNTNLQWQVKTVATGGCLAEETLVSNGKMLNQLEENDVILGFDNDNIVDTRVTKIKKHNDGLSYELNEIKTSISNVQLAYYHLIKTLKGWKPVYEIKVGDMVAHLVNNKLIYIPTKSNKKVYRKNVIDIKTECGTFFANNMLVHNIHIVK